MPNIRRLQESFGNAFSGNRNYSCEKFIWALGIFGIYGRCTDLTIIMNVWDIYTEERNRSYVFENGWGKGWFIIRRVLSYTSPKGFEWNRPRNIIDEICFRGKGLTQNITFLIALLIVWKVVVIFDIFVLYIYMRCFEMTSSKISAI